MWVYKGTFPLATICVPSIKHEKDSMHFAAANDQRTDSVSIFVANMAHFNLAYVRIQALSGLSLNPM